MFAASDLRDAFSLSRAKTLRTGVLSAIVVAFAARFLSEHYGAPAMLMALLLGIAFQFLHEEGPCRAGIDFSARTLLRAGVALLGLRVSWQLLSGLGAGAVVLTVLGVALTIGAGVLGARLLGRGVRFGVLTGGSVAICGASAAMAIAAVLPRNEHSERNLVFTVMSVTVLSTLAMIVYPMIVSALGLDTHAAGLFLGGTIHDVAQVVGAGYMVSDETGDVATVVKLLRVSMLAPVVFIISLVVNLKGLGGTDSQRKTPLLPAFVVAFLVLAAVNSVLGIPEALANVANELSRWLLLIAVAAVGMKTSLKQVREVGGQAILLVVCETVFLGLLFLGALVLRPGL
ncbi:putative sulfate exporter family transporter [Defluviimonas sp. D31]|uniref:YeiH family protein n=1 Tax=Defluviimonas sp. D31 TaxID=3083253 RepID=UPI00296F5778|nr:putative sulfate exporter family transporter [Defluviimonas sp. D31]MDW4550155.1 putative sulfate exporter family transporter [Defluviimonas sp. D31]